MILAEEKNLRFIDIVKLIINCWGDFSDINIYFYMSIKNHF